MMNPFDELDGIMQAYVVLLRRTNLEKRVMQSALQKIANGVSDPQAVAMETLILVGRLRDEKRETPEMGLDVHFAERRGVFEQLRDVRERAVQGAIYRGDPNVLEESLSDNLVTK